MTRDQCLEQIDRTVRGAAMLAQMQRLPFDAEGYRQNFYVQMDDDGHWRVFLRAKYLAEQLGWPLEYAKSWQREHGYPEEEPPIKLTAW
jgi:hypothetical protein